MGILDTLFKEENQINNKESNKNTANEEKESQKRKEFDIKINVIITEMRKHGTPEEDIYEYIEQLRAEFEEELKLPPQELAEKRRQQQIETQQKNEKMAFKRILEIYFSTDLEYDSVFQSPEEFEKIKMGYAELIKKMVEMTPEELEVQYDLIDKARRRNCERQNRHTIFKECLEKEVALKVANNVLNQEDITAFRSSRIKAFLNGEFDYPDVLKENIITEIFTHLAEYPDSIVRIIDLDNIPSIRERLEIIKQSLEGTPSKRNRNI